MKAVAARELKNRTGDVMRALRRGETLLLTFRGKPVATIIPCGDDRARTLEIQRYEEAWEEIENALRTSAPRFVSWREAEDTTRGRIPCNAVTPRDWLRRARRS
ncbi:MAG: type II toxin-antitoxin system prevent-host-death family antitoxin [Planctomycetes bacterium]|nr:type II toxin-antitoxin system prevent-host-death family antitoxin [Planctomycetota bacterium]